MFFPATGGTIANRYRVDRSSVRQLPCALTVRVAIVQAFCARCSQEDHVSQHYSRLAIAGGR